jgi:hypothetical protein
MLRREDGSVAEREAATRLYDLMTLPSAARRDGEGP